MEKWKLLYILKVYKCLSILKLCADIFQREIEHYNQQRTQQRTQRTTL